MTGAGFGDTGSLDVRLGGDLVDNLNVDVTGTQLTFRTPASVSGAATLSIVRNDDATARKTGAFTYLDPLTLIATVPARAPSTGGDVVRIVGTGFSATQ